MTVALQTLSATNKDYVSRLNNNFTALKAAVEALQAAILGSVGAGAALVTDLFDRIGVVGTDSYVLNIDEYDGGDTIQIGTIAVTSKAWGLFSGTFDRVIMDGTADLDASAIVSDLPKTIYVAVTSNGAPQLFESGVLPNVVYAYSMTWDGGSLTDFKRLATLLPGYSLIEDIARRTEIISIFDTETDWLSEEAGASGILLPGANSDNELADMIYEVVGFIAYPSRADEDGFYASQDDPENADRNHVKFKVTSEGEDWTSEDFDFDCSNIPDFQFVAVNPALTGSLYITEAQTFELERTYLGDFVESARVFQWGVVVRRVYGGGMPLNPNYVDGI